MLAVGSAAAAISAATFGPAAFASVDHPAVSRMLTKRMSAPSSATSENSGASCVQATVSGPPAEAAFLKVSSS